MTEEADPIEVEVDVKDSPEENQDIEIVKVEAGGSEPEAAPEAAPRVSNDEALEALRLQLGREQQRREAAERAAREASEAAFQAQNNVHDSNLSMVINAIDTVKQNGAILKANYRDAMAVGDFDRAADIQEEMAASAARLLQLEQGRQALESSPKPSRQEYVAPDPVETLASQLTPRSADWVRRHPEYATDTRLYQRMLAAHNLVTTDGINADTDEYFDGVERILGIRQSASNQESSMSSASAPVSRRSSPPAAPVTRSGSATGARSNVVHLTAAEREMASMMGMTEKEYAQNKLALKREGKLN